MKISTAKKLEQELQKAKVDMIPARLVWDHVDRLDGLDEALNELACLVAEEADVRVPALLNLLRDQYLELRAALVKSVGPESPATGGAA